MYPGAHVPGVAPQCPEQLQSPAGPVQSKYPIIQPFVTSQFVHSQVSMYIVVVEVEVVVIEVVVEVVVIEVEVVVEVVVIEVVVEVEVVVVVPEQL